MPSSTSSSDPGFTRHIHHEPLAPGLRLTASDRPGVAQPVPERDVPPQPWAKIAIVVLILVAVLTGLWEWQMRRAGLMVGDLGTDEGAWAVERHRLDDPTTHVAIVGDSRILFGTDLERFRQLTGVKPVQLAVAGGNALSLLEYVADKTHYNKLLIVGVAEFGYFRPGAGYAKGMMKHGDWESPSDRSSYLITNVLRRHSAMLDPDYSLSWLVAKLDHGWRAGASSPYEEVWKVETTRDARQTWMWPGIDTHPELRAHAIHAWLEMFKFPQPTPALITETEQRTRAAVAKIRARGGEVVFVRPPSLPPMRTLEEKRLPRATAWDKLVKFAQVQSVHADDLPDARGLILPELSHLSHACATVFTDAYVRALATKTPRLTIAPSAPPPLHPADCVPAKPAI